MSGPSRPLSVVKEGVPQPAVVDLICKRPACPRPVPVSVRRGAPQEYCSAACRTAAKAEYLEALKRLRRAEETVLQFRREERRSSEDAALALTPEALAIVALARDLLAATAGDTPTGPWRPVLAHLVEALSPTVAP